MVKDTANELTEEELLAAFGNGDTKAAKILSARLAPGLLSFSYQMLNNRADAEDVTQEAMFRLWKIAGQWQPGEAKITTWLFRVARNLCLDHLRKKPSANIDQITGLQDGTAGPEEKLIQEDRILALQDALLQLPERQRAAVTLRHLEGISNPEIAEILDTSVEAVESLTARAKISLSRILDKKSL